MWRTSTGERTLQGAEAILFRQALAIAWDNVEAVEFEDDPWLSGVELFDNLQLNQHVALLAMVGESLMCADSPPLELVAVTERAIGAIFQSLEEVIAVEIDLEDELEEPYFYRQLILNCLAGDDDLPEASCSDHVEWHVLIDAVASRILWDADFEDQDIYVDLPPEESAELRQRLGITDEYFTAVAPDPTDAEVDRFRSVLRELIASLR